MEIQIVKDFRTNDSYLNLWNSPQIWRNNLALSRLRLCREVGVGYGDAVQGVLLDVEAAEGRDGGGQGLQFHVRIRDGLLYHVFYVVDWVISIQT